MQFKIKSNPMLPLCGALPLPYLPARVTRYALVAHNHSFTSHRCRTSQYRRTLLPLSVSLWNDLSDPMFDGVGLVGFKPMLLCWQDLLFFLVSYYFVFFFLPWVACVGLGSLD